MPRPLRKAAFTFSKDIKNDKERIPHGVRQQKACVGVCYSSTLNPPSVHTSVLSVGMAKEEAEANAVKNIAIKYNSHLFLL